VCRSKRTNNTRRNNGNIRPRWVYNFHPHAKRNRTGQWSSFPKRGALGLCLCVLEMHGRRFYQGHESRSFNRRKLEQGKYSNSPPDIAPKVSPIDWAYSKTVLWQKLHPEHLVHLRTKASKSLKNALKYEFVWQILNIETQTGYFLISIIYSGKSLDSKNS
jgi:hypothetical protein